MGTNYYLRGKTCPECHHHEEGIHLGKSSAGWKFSFQYNGGRFYKNIQEMREWLKDKSIVNEYDESISQDEFWKMVESKQKIQEPVGTEYEDDPRNILRIDGYKFYDTDFS